MHAWRNVILVIVLTALVLGGGTFTCHTGGGSFTTTQTSDN